MHQFWRDLRYLLNRRDLVRFSVPLGGLVVNSLLELLSLATVPLFITLLLSGGHEDNSASLRWTLERFANLGVETPSGRLWLGGLAVLVANGVRMAWMIVCISLQMQMLNHRKVELSSRLLECYVKAPAAFHTARNTGDLVNRAVVECDHVLQHVVAPFLELLQNSVVLFCICALLCTWMPLMTVLAVASLALFGGGFLSFHQRRMRLLGAQEQSGRTQAMTSAREALAGRIEATFLAKRAFFLQRFHSAMELVTNAQRAYDVQLRVIWPYLEFVSLSVILLVTLISLYLHHGDLTAVAPQIALLGMALVRLRSNAINLLHSWTLLRYHRISLHIVCEDLRLFDEAHTKTSSGETLALAAQDAILPRAFDREITVQNLSFRHPDATGDTLKNLSFSIAKGEAIAIVGPTGGGKSTLLQLLAGILQPTAGNILVDGLPLNSSEDRLAWQHAIGYVPQRLFLTDDTLEGNIALGVEAAKIDREALDTAITAAQLEDVVTALPQGLATRLGEQGARLSGGQNQRIAIARTLYRRPKVLFFDEATSALDAETERRLASTLETFAKTGQTLVVVTHRLASIRNFDRLLVVDRGQIVAQGSYDDLLANSALFQSLQGKAER